MCSWCSKFNCALFSLFVFIIVVFIFIARCARIAVLHLLWSRDRCIICCWIWHAIEVVARYIYIWFRCSSVAVVPGLNSVVSLCAYLPVSETATSSGYQLLRQLDFNFPWLLCVFSRLGETAAKKATLESAPCKAARAWKCDYNLKERFLCSYIASPAYPNMKESDSRACLSRSEAGSRIRSPCYIFEDVWLFFHVDCHLQDVCQIDPLTRRYK